MEESGLISKVYESNDTMIYFIFRFCFLVFLALSKPFVIFYCIVLYCHFCHWRKKKLI